MPLSTEEGARREAATRMVRVIPRHHAMLQTIAAAEGRTFSEVLIRILDEWQRTRSMAQHMEDWLRTQQTEAEHLLQHMKERTR